MRKSVLERFKTQGDSGKIYELVIFQNWIDTSSKDGVEFIPGLKEVVVSSGGHANVRGDEFEIVATGELVRRI